MIRGLLVVGLISVARVAAAQEHVSLGGRDAQIWRPTSTGKAPLVIFSHGFGGCAAQSKFLMEGLAAHGYVVVAPNHKDAHCGRVAGRPQPEEPFRDAEKWTDGTFVDRRDDVRAVLDGLRQSVQFRDRIDFDRIALAGHSLGGYTVMGLAGGWPSWKMPGVRAVLALSPYVEPYIAHRTLGGVDVPVMYQGGTLDFGITPSVERSSGAYDETPSPKVFVDFTRAGHLAWTDLRGDVHQNILNYALPFFDRYVKGVSAGSSFTAKAAGVAALRFDTVVVRR